MMKNKLLFVCTGNYYRSRFAEAYFNHLATLHRIGWSAYSKGLSQNMPSPNNPGPISVNALEALKVRGVKGIGIDRYPEPLVDSDFAKYERVIAMSELEHRPMLEDRFTKHLDRIEFFEVGDLPLEAPKQAMDKTASLVEGLVRMMAKNRHVA